MPAITGPVKLPGGQAPVPGTWRARIRTNVHAAIDADGTIRAGEEQAYDEGDGASMMLPIGAYEFTFKSQILGPGGRPIVLGPYAYEVTGDATWGDVMDTPYEVPVTPSDVALAEAARVGAQQAAERAEAVPATTDGQQAYNVQTPGTATNDALEAQTAGKTRTFTADQRFTTGVPHIDVTGLGVPTDGGSDAQPALQAIIDTAPRGARINFPPRLAMRLASTLKVPASKAGIHLWAPGGASYNESLGSQARPLLVADAGVTALQIGDDVPSGVTYRGTKIEGLGFREAGDAKTATQLRIHATVNCVFRDVSWKGGARAVLNDGFGYDGSWQHFDNPYIHSCLRGIESVGGDIYISSGNLSTQGWAVYAVPKGSVLSAVRLMGAKIDATGPTGEGAVYTEGEGLEAIGVKVELGVNNGQVAYKIRRDATKHNSSGRFNKVIGGVISGTTGTGHTAVDIGAGCAATVVDGTALANITTRLADAGTDSTIQFAGLARTTSRSAGVVHYEVQNVDREPLLQILSDAANSVQFLMKKTAGKFRYRLAGKTFSDEFAVQDNDGTPLFRVLGDGRTQFLGGPAVLRSYTTAQRPTPANASKGGVILDETLGRPIISDGATWRNFDGSAA